jgi:hypothetical protein
VRGFKGSLLKRGFISLFPPYELSKLLSLLSFMRLTEEVSANPAPIILLYRAIPPVGGLPNPILIKMLNKNSLLNSSWFSER